MPICDGCGSSYDDHYKFCPHCGSAKPEPQTIRVQVEEKRPKNACPVCERIDQVRKVSAIYSADTARSEGSSHTVSTGSLSGSGEYRNRDGDYLGQTTSSGTSISFSTSTTSGYSQSDLSKLVAPPRKPVEPQLQTHGIGSAASYVEFVILIGIAILTLWIYIRWMWSSGVNPNAPDLLAGLGCFVVPFIGAVLGFFPIHWLEHMYFRSANQQAKAHHEAKMSQHAKDVIAWETAVIPIANSKATNSSVPD